MPESQLSWCNEEGPWSMKIRYDKEILWFDLHWLICRCGASSAGGGSTTIPASEQSAKCRLPTQIPSQPHISIQPSANTQPASRMKHLPTGDKHPTNISLQKGNRPQELISAKTRQTSSKQRVKPGTSKVKTTCRPVLAPRTPPLWCSVHCH